MYELEDKVAVVTGAGSGIGRALACAFAERGCRVAVADIDTDGLAGTVALLPQDRMLAHRIDVADRAQVEDFASAVLAHFGGAHVVVNNAGVSVAETVEHLTWDDFEWLMGINFWGVMYGTKAFLPHMLARDEGTIVNISSIFGIIGVPAQSAYNASKFAVRGFTEALRHELRDRNVRAICVHPGGIQTNIVRNARIRHDHKGRTDRGRLEREFDRAARTTPEAAAAVIIDAVVRGRERVLIGADAKLMDRLQRWMPASYWNVIGPLVDRLTK